MESLEVSEQDTDLDEQEAGIMVKRKGNERARPGSILGAEVGQQGPAQTGERDWETGTKSVRSAAFVAQKASNSERRNLTYTEGRLSLDSELG